MIFFGNDRQDLPCLRNRPLYVTVSVRDVELKLVMVDLMSSLNIIFLFTLKSGGVSGIESPSSSLRYPILKVSPRSLLAPLTLN